MKRTFPTTPSSALSHALDLLDDLRAAGYVVAPSIPDPVMIAAGARISGIPEATVDMIYRTMLRAAEKSLAEA